MIAQKLTEIINILSTSTTNLPLDKELWNPQKCADYLSISQSHFKQRIANKTTFPRPIDISDGDGERGTYRWIALEVINWALANKKR